MLFQWSDFDPPMRFSVPFRSSESLAPTVVGFLSAAGFFVLIATSSCSNAVSPPNAPKPTKLEQFVASHPAVAAASGTVATPDSFAHEEYHGIDAFVFVNK